MKNEDNHKLFDPKKKQDFHTHTFFCDGKDSPEAMVLAAVNAGLDTIGICTHSHVAFDDCCIRKERYSEFQAQIAGLKDKYRDKIEVLCGVEQDMFSDMGTEGFDYVIGSVHYLPAEGDFIPVDQSPETLLNACEKYYDGDIYRLCECYYSYEAKAAEKTKCDLIAHFDLISKFNEQVRLFDTENERYVRAYERALDELLKAGVPFEVNTGAISRGYRTTPYPSAQIRNYIKAHGGRLLLSSDSHSEKTVAFLFDKYRCLL